MGTLERAVFKSKTSQATARYPYFSHMQLMTTTNKQRVAVQFSSPMLADTDFEVETSIFTETDVITNKGALADEPPTLNETKETHNIFIVDPNENSGDLIHQNTSASIKEIF